MGSTFTTFPDKFDQTSIIGTKRKLPIYLQFVPGIVIDVVSTKQQIAAVGNLQKISSIIAMPHETHLGIKKPSEAGEEFRYYPLLRGIQEIPTPGDPVILCTMGGVQYYLGPLNTDGSPTWNEDKFKNNQIGVEFNNIVQSEGSLETPLFNKSILFQRLHKLLNNKLDNPLNPNAFVSDTIHGDLMLEGRHGNSIRIGSRSVNPYIIISNGRVSSNPVETSLDGTILAIVKHGSIRDHFNMDTKKFTLADEEFANSKGKSKAKRSITSTFAKPLGRGVTADSGIDTNINKVIYEYNENQLFISSDRITFNARKESMFLSAYKHIHFGCGSSMTFSTSKNILTEAAGEIRMRTDGLFAIECEKLYIDGRQKILLGNPILDDTMHKAVLGDALVTQLSKMFWIMKEMCYITSKVVENRALPGGSLTTMKEIIESIDNELGMVYRIGKHGPSNKRYPKGLADLILSNKVFLKG